MSLATVPCNSVCTFVFFSTTNQVIYDIYLHDFRDAYWRSANTVNGLGLSGGENGGDEGAARMMWSKRSPTGLRSSEIPSVMASPPSPRKKGTRTTNATTTASMIPCGVDPTPPTTP
ncbi:BnaA05g30590D [Brassica napus]|uniref:BnaA05g30590D protein n=1 Tax=Brassica napus TaxID=3708 RepID=A0A078GDR3_BRANA|nr:BnaA05g30590D [Brassica napus]